MDSMYEMPVTKEQESWLDRWWGLLLVLFGVSFVLLLALFHPHY